MSLSGSRHDRLPDPIPSPGFRHTPASWIELDSEALRSNIAVFRQFAPSGGGRALGAVLKGDAYGHGLQTLLPLLHSQVDILYFIDPADALKVRDWEQAHQASARRLLVLGAVSARDVVALAAQDVEIVIGDAGWIDILSELRRRTVSTPIQVHLHVDTGLGREGFADVEVPDALPWLAAARDVVQLRGVLSHFANTEDVTDQSYARLQLQRLDDAARRMRERWLIDTPLERHLAASAAALVLPDSRLDALRIGIAVYGLWPSAETRLSARVVLGEIPMLKPVLSWRCRSQTVKWLPTGAFVGYGCTYRCRKPTRVAVLPVGYFDGYPRAVSGRAHVLVNGRQCPVLGRVMMNHIVIDVTDATDDERPVTATLIGHDGDEQLGADLLASWAGTIHYEIVTRLGAHLERRVV